MIVVLAIIGTLGNAMKGFKKIDWSSLVLEEHIPHMSGSDPTLISDYVNYLQRYSEMVASFEKWEEEDLNTEELNYYIAVQTRVTQKLLTVSQ